MSTEDRRVVAAYRAARVRSRWRPTLRLRWQTRWGRRRAGARGLDMAEWAALAAVRHELEARGIHTAPISPAG
jgi:hypothetical protein